MLQLVWIASAIVIVTAGVRSRAHQQALRTGHLAC